MKVAAIVILYYPGEEVVANILSYSEHFDRLYIFDNTSSGSTIQEQLQTFRGLLLFHDGENRGIPERLNAGCRMAVEEGYDWVLTMDQDTSFVPETITSYLNCFYKYPEKDSIAIIGTRYGRIAEPSNAACRPETAEDAITSGMLLNLKIWEQMNGFDEALFIDSVDHEYCIRVTMNGFKIIRFTNIHILHQVGTLVYRSSVKSLFLICKKKEIHSPLRCYYMYRNMLYLENKYRQTNPAFSKLIRKYVEGHMKVCLLYGRQRTAIKKYIEIAKQDFLNNCMGKISDKKEI